jgi:hypothetical protein
LLAPLALLARPTCAPGTRAGFIFLLLFTPVIDKQRLAAASGPGGLLLPTDESLRSFADLETGFGHFLQAWLSSYAIGALLVAAGFELGSYGWG